ncbi:hypothetical protein JG687_00015624 [Phytophthora cactorum]|uniref:Uncharacterized protein n=1 Tax=Phytophthora cactorum TaxID=29920 RepID=A0A329S5E9_9STRA|nr:hypothetical protein Pcac1_g655 [Phytophthora cactorum]KAG2816787.1 hypothetical protein PC112_g13316 [Phytophthora cactorum]KAG2818806.1 hypothetical protein PC111_g12164 [Phytophthora cactorum]KAG2854109.1 hypothetical protein PC113_g13611 [Phytophthora cactorum]KAG2910159.1 hypothetical protein PC114_g9855 [Phytophthora cactorum]
MWYSAFLLVLFACFSAAHSTSDLASGSSSDFASSSGSTGDVYNVCPVVVDFTEEQDDLSDDELKANAADAAMSAYLLSHPNNTLWDYFKIEHKQKKAMSQRLPLKERIKNAIKGVVDYTANTVIYLAQDIANAVKWIVNTLRDPLVGIKQVTTFFTTFGKNIKSLWTLFKEDPKDTAKNMAGGLLLHITHHPAEFTAETVLTVSAGFAVIGGLLAGVEAVFGGMSNMISNVLMSVLMFIHAIDDPIYIVTPLVNSIVDTAGAIGTGTNSSNSSDTLTIDPIKPLKACKIPKAYRPVFSSRDLCLSSPAKVRELIFGTDKRTFKMTTQERIAAYNHFHDFVCCFLQDQEFEVNAPKMDPTKFENELVPTPVKMRNCSLLLANYSDDTVWEAPANLDESTSLDDTEDASSEETN